MVLSILGGSNMMMHSAATAAQPPQPSSSPTPSLDSLVGGITINGANSSSSSTSSESGLGTAGLAAVSSSSSASSASSSSSAAAAATAAAAAAAATAGAASSSSASSSGLGSSPQLLGGVTQQQQHLLGGVSQQQQHATLLGADFGGLLDFHKDEFLPNLDHSSSSTSSLLGSLSNVPVTSSSGCEQQQQQFQEMHDLEFVNHLVHEGKNKVAELRATIKSLEAGSSRLTAHVSRAQAEVAETFRLFHSLLEERKTEVLRELEATFSSKQVAMAICTQRTQEAVEKIYNVIEFVERSSKQPNEASLYKRALEQRLGAILSTYHEALGNANVNPEQVIDFDFVAPSYTTIQGGIKNSFGYVRTRTDSGNSTNSGSGHASSNGHTLSLAVGGGSGGKQPPISRPVSGSTSSGNNNIINNNSFSNGSLLGGGLAASILAGGGGSGGSGVSSFNGVPLSGPLHGLLDRQGGGKHSSYGFHSSLSMSPDSDLFPSKRFSRGGLSLGGLGPIGTDLQLNHSGGGSGSGGSGNNSNPYERWSNGNDGNANKQQHLLYGSGSNGDAATAAAAQAAAVAAAHHHAAAQMAALTNGHASVTPTSSNSSEHGNSNGLLDLNSKLLNHQVSLFPPKSQIKRQKMVYHCKFGEFGVLEGQFTEPSGVAVNAQNDIIVADTNNHRIQIFDKEGRFKFQFGECGKRDGQLLYPNRVAVVRQSGDIIVTERSPTHQVQIYNQYGQFVRKFGANILQHPRGVCVDNKGRIVVVECKVMRVIIFDQLGNVLNKFGCSKHLEFPNGVVVNDRQEIFISDNRAHCVKVFNYEGTYLRQIGGEGITNYPIGVGINAAGEVTIADNHNNFNLSVFSQDGQLLNALESKVKHAQCFDVSLMDDGSVVLASKDYRLYIYRYVQVPSAAAAAAAAVATGGL